MLTPPLQKTRAPLPGIWYQLVVPSFTNLFALLLRMWGAARALVWGENLSSDPVGAALGLALHYFSQGQVSVDVAQLSQVCE